MKRTCLLVVVLALALAGCKSAATPAPLESMNIPRPMIPDRSFKITDYGAVGDGKADNTASITKTIDACKQAGGGKVIVPPGTFITGPIELVSDMALVLEKGATLRGTEDIEAYGKPLEESGDVLLDEFRPLVKPLITANGARHLEIRGEGVIDGAGQKWWERRYSERQRGAPGGGERRPTTVRVYPRPRIMLLTDCNILHIDGITLKDSPNFNIALLRCEDVVIENTTITAPPRSPNTDGIDPANCRNVLIRKCTIDVGDDNVSFKCVRGSRPLENVMVTDCTFKHGHGASVGSSLGSGVRNVTVQRTTFENTHPAIRIKSARDRGEVVENIVYRDLKLKNVGTAITINMYYFDRSGMENRQTKPITPTTPIIRNIRIENVTIDGARLAGEIIGLPEMPITDVVLKDVTITAEKGLKIRDAKGVRMENVQIKPKEGQPITSEFAEVSQADAK